MLRFVLDTDTFSLFLRGHSQVTANVLGRPLAETVESLALLKLLTFTESAIALFAILRKQHPPQLTTGRQRRTRS